ncbi:MAG: NAD(P)H-hydrate dehydratase [Acidobacteriota bacterium]|nr:NAD(P)H-hydrate dehydratase [Acidobacteriota bacterium]
MRVLTSQQMREADRRTISDIGIPGIVLMENAGRQIVSAMEAHIEGLHGGDVAVLAGRGNNGGDGFVVARTLVQRGIDASVFLFGRVGDVTGDARVNLNILGQLGISVVEIADAQAWELHSGEALGADVIVDAIFGTGLRDPLSGLLETVAADVNAAGKPVVAVDLPSGLSADSPEPPGPFIEATMTVTLAAPKVPLVLPPAEGGAGDLVIADIGIPHDVIDDLEGPKLSILTRESMRTHLEPRAQDSHKGDYGRVLIVAGSIGKTGAAFLAGMAALRSGAGLVTVATPRSALPILASMGPEIMTLPLDETPEGTVDFSAVDEVLAFPADVIAVGPGLGTSPGTTAFVHALVERSATTLVLDADALNAFAGEPDRLVAREGVDIIVTPHPGELARLIGLSTDDVQRSRLELARDFAASHRVTVVLKGHRTIIATPDGSAYINLTGNPGMATAGTGDVLTGMVAAWAAQLMDCEAASQLAVYLHGLAGDLAEADDSDVSLIASDVISRLGDAMAELTARKRRQPAS